MTVPPILFCPICQCDTLPLPSGLCAFCDNRLVKLTRAPRQRKPKPVEPRKPAAWWVRRQQRLGLWP